MKHGNYVDVAHQQSRAKRITAQRATGRVIHGLRGSSGKNYLRWTGFCDRVSRLKRGILTVRWIQGYADLCDRKYRKKSEYPGLHISY